MKLQLLHDYMIAYAMQVIDQKCNHRDLYI